MEKYAIIISVIITVIKFINYLIEEGILYVKIRRNEDREESLGSIFR